MTALLVLVVSLTSVAAVVFGIRKLGVDGHDLIVAWRMLLECVGLAAVFFAVNIGLAAIVIVGSRTLGIAFVSAYVMSDVMWPVCSMLQAVTFRWWLASKVPS